MYVPTAAAQRAIDACIKLPKARRPGLSAIAASIGVSVGIARRLLQRGRRQKISRRAASKAKIRSLASAARKPIASKARRAAGKLGALVSDRTARRATQTLRVEKEIRRKANFVRPEEHSKYATDFSQVERFAMKYWL